MGLYIGYICTCLIIEPAGLSCNGGTGIIVEGLTGLYFSDSGKNNVPPVCLQPAFTVNTYHVMLSVIHAALHHSLRSRFK